MIRILVNFPLSSALQARLRADAGDNVELLFAEGWDSSGKIPLFAEGWDSSGKIPLFADKDVERAKREIADVEVIFGQVTLELLRLAGKLRWVQTPFASQEKHMFPELVSSQVVLTNTAGIYSEEIADHVYALMLGLVRQIHRFTRNQMRHYWEPASGFKHRVDYLAGKTLGIIGLGGIGSEVARRAPGFGMRVIATRANPDRPKPDYVDQVWGSDGIDRLLAESDIVAICVPETPRTRRLIGSRELDLMKPTAHIINVGRSAVIDQEALIRALEDGSIAGAGLDVPEPEPLPADHSLWDMDNVIITPHMASDSEVHPDIYPPRRVEIFLSNLRRYLAGKPLENLVDKADWH